MTSNELSATVQQSVADAGRGLNLGLQDAANLGWKLAARIRGHGTESLLDSYHDERHPVAARVLVSARAQGVLGLPDPDAAVVREVVTALLAVPEARHAVALELSGIGIAYPGPWAGPLRSRYLRTAEECSSARHHRRAGPTASRPARARRRCWPGQTATWSGPAAPTWKTPCPGGSAPPPGTTCRLNSLCSTEIRDAVRRYTAVHSVSMWLPSAITRQGRVSGIRWHAKKKRLRSNQRAYGVELRYLSNTKVRSTS
ncbi:MAG TPA: FAD-dependent monooxygenase [Pseudonocardiaceae bacterium]|nr:FAD-dependent monooxygenase [Pseudonocardiaceae bacterium]